MTFSEFIAYGLATPLVVYLAVRFASAAYFKSKQQYDNQRK